MPTPRWTAALLLPLVILSVASAANPDPVDIAINTARVWLTAMNNLASAVNTSTLAASNTLSEFTITRAHSMELESYMVAASGQVADVASAITAFTADDLQSGYAFPMMQFPYGWAPSEVFYNVAELGDTPLKLDACAVAGLLMGNITNWDDPALVALNPDAALPSEPVTLVYLNLSMPITQSLTEYLSDLCPTWVHGVLDNLAEVVAPLADTLIASTDVEGCWNATHLTPGAISIGSSMPVGIYVKKYPEAMQYAMLQIEDGSFAAPSGELDVAADSVLPTLVPSPDNNISDWSGLYTRSPGLYPVAYYGLMTVPQDLTQEGVRSHYIKDTVGYLLTAEGQAMVSVTDEFGVPPSLMPAANKAWASIKVSDDVVDTGILTPAKTPSPSPAPAPAAEPTPAPAPTAGAAQRSVFGSLLAAAAATMALLVLA